MKVFKGEGNGLGLGLGLLLVCCTCVYYLLRMLLKRMQAVVKSLNLICFWKNQHSRTRVIRDRTKGR